MARGLRIGYATAGTDYNLPGATGAYQSTGQSNVLRRKCVVPANRGTHTVTGRNANLVYSPVTPPGPWVLGQAPFVATTGNVYDEFGTYWPNTTWTEWNVPIPGNAIFTNIPNGGLPDPGVLYSNYYWVSYSEYSPAIHVGQSTDYLVNVTHPDSWGWPARTTTNPLQIRLPAGATGASGTDQEMIAIDLSTNFVHSFWIFNRTSNTTATAGAYGGEPLDGDGWGTRTPQFRAAGTWATGSSCLAGFPVEAETTYGDGEFHHALPISGRGNIVAGYPQAGQQFVGKAINADGDVPYANARLFEGARYGIPAGVSMPTGMSSLGQKVFRAMQTYGCFCIDKNYGNALAQIRIQAPPAYSDTIATNLINDVQKIFGKLKRVRW